MSDEVAAQAVRHSDRLIELLPDNPASHEFAFHAAMHSPAPEPDFVCRCDASYPISAASYTQVLCVVASELVVNPLASVSATPCSSRWHASHACTAYLQLGLGCSNHGPVISDM